MTQTTIQRRTVLWLGMAFALAAMIVCLSLSRTVLELPGDASGRYAHVMAYAALMLVLLRTYTTTRSRIVVAAALIALGVCLELLQAWTGYRNYERGDMVANAAGIVVGWFAERTLGTLESLRKSVGRV